MAKLLYRLGGFSARKPWVVITTWLVVLALAGIGYGFGHGALSDAISIPGTETMRVTDEMAKKVPSFSGGSGTVVFETSNGKVFTQKQQDAIADVMDKVADTTGVKKAVNPFQAQQEKDDHVAQVNDGIAKIAEAKTTLSVNEKKLEDGKTQLADGEKQLAEGEKQIDSGQQEINANKLKLSDGQQQIDANTSKVLTGQQQIADAWSTVNANQSKINSGLAQVKQQQAVINANRSKLQSAKEQLDSSAAKLEAGNTQLTQAQQQYDAGVQKLSTARQGFASLTSARDTLVNSIASVESQMENAGCSAQNSGSQSEQCAGLQSSLDALQHGTPAQNGQAAQPGLDGISKSIADLIAGVQQQDASVTDEGTLNAYFAKQQAQLDAAREQIAQGRAQLNYTANMQKITQGRAQLDYTDNIAKLNAGQTQLNDAQTKLADGQRQLNTATATLKSKQQELSAGLLQLRVAEQQISSGWVQLNAGQTQIDEAKASIAANKSKIADSKVALASGERQLQDGKKQVAVNEAKLKEGKELIALADGINMVSDDGSTALGNVVFTESTLSVDPAVKQAVMKKITDADISGVKTEFSSDISQSIPEVGSTEIIGVIVAAIVLFIMLGTLVAAGLPLISALLGVGIGALTALAFSGMLQMMSVTPVLGLMLGLAVGIDYSLFILNRHRRQLRQGMAVKESIALATGTSGSAVMFAGSTVIIALLALNVTGLDFLGIMGDAAAICILMAVLLAISFVPAMLSLLGMRLLPKRQRGVTHAVKVPVIATKPMGNLRAVLTLIVGLAALVAIALPAADMRLGIPDGSSEPVDSTQYQAYKTVARQFGNGQNGALVVTAKIPQSVSSDDLTSTELAIAQQIGGVKDVKAVAPVGNSDDRKFIVFQVLPETGPTSEETEQLVHRLRDMSPLNLTVQGHDDSGNAKQVFSGDVTLGIAGNASMNIDMSEKLAAVLPTYLMIVIGLSFLILMLVFRSILVPLIAAGGFALSVLATFGGLTAIFQWGWFANLIGVHDPGPILSFLPVLLIGILFGLAMDYQLFLVSGMREAYAHGTEARASVMRGFKAGRSVVTAAAIIMIAVFMGFAGSDSAMIKSIGFALAFGVLVDAFIVRMMLVPATMHLLGRAAWWFPKWLDRIMPNVDVEGASLERADTAVI